MQGSSQWQTRRFDLSSRLYFHFILGHTNFMVGSLLLKFEYLMNKNDHGKVWFLDPTGMPTAGWGLSLSAYEMAQIGLMVLNNGVYNNTRIISENWIEMMTKSYISTDEKFGNQDYGFLWWLPHRTRDVIAAIGDGGNIIYVDRKNQIVVAITAHFKPMVFDRVEYIEKNIVEALTER